MACFSIGIISHKLPANDAGNPVKKIIVNLYTRINP